MCDLDETVGKSCILRTPSLTIDWTSATIKYMRSSDDVKLTAELLLDGVPDVNYTLLAIDDDRFYLIPNESPASYYRLQLTASRYLVSTDDYAFAVVTSVIFYDRYRAPVLNNKGTCEIVNCS